MFRESDLIDVWFDSGSYLMLNGIIHLRTNQKLKITKPFQPIILQKVLTKLEVGFTLFIQLRGTVFNSVAYKNVISNGLVLDKNGQKMSKDLEMLLTLLKQCQILVLMQQDGI